jgi:DNA-binding PadR family transcriptional regulator
MLLRYAILGLLEGQELHGYRIKSVFEERLGPVWSLNFGQIYQTLKDLKRRGLVESRYDKGDSHMGRMVYTVTPKGRRALDTWLARAPRAPQPTRDEIFIRLLVLDRKDVDASVAQLARQEHLYREYLTRLTVNRRALEPLVTEEHLLNSLAADAALFQAEAHLKWLGHCEAILRSWNATAHASSAVADEDAGIERASADQRRSTRPSSRRSHRIA